jgi:hypothetical protein
MGELTSLLHAVCPYDYYSEEMRAGFAWWEGSTGSTRCGGQVDVPGALAGAWFRPHCRPVTPCTAQWIGGSLQRWRLTG